MRAWAVRVVQVGVQVRLGGGNRRFRPAHHPRHKLNHHHHLCSCVQIWCVCVVCVCGEWGATRESMASYEERNASIDFLYSSSPTGKCAIFFHTNGFDQHTRAHGKRAVRAGLAWHAVRADGPWARRGAAVGQVVGGGGRWMGPHRELDNDVFVALNGGSHQPAEELILPHVTAGRRGHPGVAHVPDLCLGVRDRNQQRCPLAVQIIRDVRDRLPEPAAGIAHVLVDERNRPPPLGPTEQRLGVGVFPECVVDLREDRVLAAQVLVAPPAPRPLPTLSLRVFRESFAGLLGGGVCGGEKGCGRPGGGRRTGLLSGR